jgi:hypothetical protein
LQAERDCTIVVVDGGSFGAAPPCLTQPVTGTRCCIYPTTRAGRGARTAWNVS